MLTISPPGLPADSVPAAAIRARLGRFRNGAGDPTTRLVDGEFVRATFTAAGPATMRIRWGGPHLGVEAWGPGADDLLALAGSYLGLDDDGYVFHDAHPAVMRAQRHHPDVRLAASRNLYHELLPTVIAQRITAGEAAAQWRKLCIQLGEPAPGPFAGMRLPPHPDRLAAMPTWWFHPLGIERSRASTLVEVARHAPRIAMWSAGPSTEVAHLLQHLRGIGDWTIGMVLATAHGEPDAVAVGDHHLKNIVAFALAGEARATDERMLELLEPYRGQRGRVVRLLQLDGHGAPKFGPRRRILPMARW